ncbi:hypothetical protein [Nonomuraea typhae]|uniref:Uncharacterized protein n=1 Tax=Nonomuraea typhae TaxID=2603600 RepID=A0ABW7YXP3_9ACTN
MSAQPIHADQPRVPKTIGGVSRALRRMRRAQFFAELLEAQQGPELDGVLNSWWGRAMLDSDPQRDRIRSAAGNGTVPTTSMEEVARRRQEQAAQA